MTQHHFHEPTIPFTHILRQTQTHLANKYSSKREHYNLELISNILNYDETNQSTEFLIDPKHRINTMDIKYDECCEHFTNLNKEKDSLMELKQLSNYYKLCRNKPVIFAVEHFGRMFIYEDKMKEMVYGNLKKLFHLSELWLPYNSRTKSTFNFTRNLENIESHILNDISTQILTQDINDESKFFAELNEELQIFYGEPEASTISEIDELCSFNYKNEETSNNNKKLLIKKNRNHAQKEKIMKKNRLESTRWASEIYSSLNPSSTGSSKKINPFENKITKKNFEQNEEPKYRKKIVRFQSYCPEDRDELKAENILENNFPNFKNAKELIKQFSKTINIKQIKKNNKFSVKEKSQSQVESIYSHSFHKSLNTKLRKSQGIEGILKDKKSYQNLNSIEEFRKSTEFNRKSNSYSTFKLDTIPNKCKKTFILKKDENSFYNSQSKPLIINKKTTGKKQIEKSVKNLSIYHWSNKIKKEQKKEFNL